MDVLLGLVVAVASVGPGGDLDALPEDVCPAEAQPYLRCVADGGPLYYCPGYGEGSPCFAELSTLAACVNED